VGAVSVESRGTTAPVQPLRFTAEVHWCATIPFAHPFIFHIPWVSIHPVPSESIYSYHFPRARAIIPSFNFSPRFPTQKARQGNLGGRQVCRYGSFSIDRNNINPTGNHPLLVREKKRIELTHYSVRNLPPRYLESRYLGIEMNQTSSPGPVSRARDSEDSGKTIRRRHDGQERINGVGL
jgi:hypothetical protein